MEIALMRKGACAAVLAVLASAAGAAEVGPCDNLDRISFLVGQTRSFYENKVTVAHVDTDGEPVCCSSHLLIFIPAEPFGRQCFALSQNAAKGGNSPRGFSNVGFDQVKASYDPQRGLLLTVPYTLYTDGRTGRPGVAQVRVNLSKEGSVRIER